VDSAKLKKTKQKDYNNDSSDLLISGTQIKKEKKLQKQKHALQLKNTH